MNSPSPTDARPRRILAADPGASFAAHQVAIRAAIERVLTSGRYILGEEGEAFEREFSVYQGGGYTVGVANGTDAIALALQAVGVQPGDRVATVANTVTATVAAIAEVGAIPCFVEIDGDTMTMCPAALEQLLKTVAVRAVVPVHLYGQPAALPELCRIAQEHGAIVIEDCAQAHGATIGGRRVGSWGGAAAFSFYPTKNLGALGDAGAVYTTDASVAERVRSLRQYGWRQRYVAESQGRNSRLDEIQAAVLRARLPFLEKENQQRRHHANLYRTGLQGTVLQLPRDDDGAVYHQFVARHPQREALRLRLESEQVFASILYPVPVHWQPAYRLPECSLPTTERACAEVLSLPVHPELRPEEIRRVIDVTRSWLARSDGLAS